MPDSLDDLKHKGILAHHILAMTGNMGAITGHVFIRTPENDGFLARSRHPGDTTPTFVREEAYHKMNFEGRPLEEMGDWVFPPERYIAMAIFKARPDVNCVIHSHPMYQVLCSIANVPIRPIVGSAYGGEAVTAAWRGIPVYPRTNLISSWSLGRAVQETIGNNNELVLKSHGNVITGATVEKAVMRAVSIEALANVNWQIAQSGREVPNISMDDYLEGVAPVQQAALDAGAGNNPLWTWDYYVRLLEEGGGLQAEAINRSRFGTN